MNSFGAWLISVGDCASQLLGRFLFVYAFGQWQCWTASPNESISGAAWRWHLLGRFHWVHRAIDRVFLIIWRQPDHCREAFVYDYHRAVKYEVDAERLMPVLTYSRVSRGEPL